MLWPDVWAFWDWQAERAALCRVSFPTAGQGRAELSWTPTHPLCSHSFPSFLDFEKWPLVPDSLKLTEWWGHFQESLGSIVHRICLLFWSTVNCIFLTWGTLLGATVMFHITSSALFYTVKMLFAHSWMPGACWCGNWKIFPVQVAEGIVCFPRHPCRALTAGGRGTALGKPGSIPGLGMDLLLLPHRVCLGGECMYVGTER